MGVREKVRVFVVNAFTAISQTLAENLKKNLMNRPEVKRTVEQGAHHQPKYWAERFGPAMSIAQHDVLHTTFTLLCSSSDAQGEQQHGK